jgi:thiamine-phosphate pyrophosphorylase
MAKALRGLYAITPDIADTARLVGLVRQALAGGVRLVQYRNKAAGAVLRRAQAQALLARCRERDAALIVNDDLDLAVAIGADGVHLGRDDGATAMARKRLGNGGLLGVSCYDQLERAREAAAAGADYVAFGSIYASPTKPAAVRAPLALLTEAKRELGLSVAAIGGITVGNASDIIAAGADLLAVISDLFEAPDVTARARAYARLFSETVES